MARSKRGCDCASEWLAGGYFFYHSASTFQLPLLLQFVKKKNTHTYETHDLQIKYMYKEFKNNIQYKIEKTKLKFILNSELFLLFLFFFTTLPLVEGYLFFIYICTLLVTENPRTGYHTSRLIPGLIFVSRCGLVSEGCRTTLSGNLESDSCRCLLLVLLLLLFLPPSSLSRFFKRR